MENKDLKKQEVTAAEAAVASTVNYKKTAIIGGIVILIAVVAILVVMIVRNNGNAAADEAIGKADIEQNDSIALELYKQAATHGYKSGNRAKLAVAIRLYEEGKYEEAAKYLKDASVDSPIVAAGAYSLEGDCYANLDKLDDALKCYDKAISEADGNEAIVPFILVKKANIYREQKKYTDEMNCYKTILDEYPSYGRNAQNPMMSAGIRKYYERAKAAAEKK